MVIAAAVAGVCGLLSAPAALAATTAATPATAATRPPVQVTDLGLPAGAFLRSNATVVNDQGVVAGGGPDPAYGYHGFIWRQGTV
ncbi:hypothetical protein, partial [Frankia sp. AvcI1]